MRRKILMGVFALALPIGTMAGLTSSASATKAPPNPTTCHLAASVNISPPLSAHGTLSVKGATGTTTVHVTWSSCTNGGVGGNTIVIVTKAAKDKNWAADGNVKTDFYLGLCGGFASTTTTKSLGKAVKNLPVNGGKLAGAKAAAGAVGGETGFIISHGTVKGGTNPTASHAALIKAGLINDPNNSNLVTGCHTGPVSTIDIDPSTSTGTL
jgi:hypothetical protein